MKTVTYKSVRDGVAKRMGIETSSNFLSSQKAVIAEYIQSSMRIGWEWFDWPELLKTEQRTPVSNVVSLTQSSQTEIGIVYDIFWDDPRVDVNERKIKFVENDSGILITDREFIDNGQTYVWIQFQTSPPLFTSSEYSATASYVVGDVVYYDTTGECYVCILANIGTLPTSTTYWTKQDVPYILSEFVKMQAYAETLAEDGQIDKSVFSFRRAEDLLVSAMDNSWLRQGQVKTFRRI